MQRFFLILTLTTILSYIHQDSSAIFIEHMKNIQHLLIVDDDKNFRFTVVAALKDEGYEIDEASDGKEAIDAIRKHTFDAALLDIRIPNLDGIEVLKIIRQESPTTDCIMITGYQDIEQAIEALKLGAKEYLQKPLAVDDLIQRVKTILRAHEAETHIKKLQTDFTSKVLHNLLTPLRTLKSAVEFLEEGTASKLTDQEKKMFQSIDTTINNMDALLNDMIDLNSFESGRVDIEKFPINLDELIPAACAPFIPQTNAKKIEMSVHVDDNIPTVEADPTKIEQVMNQLLENAIKYTADGGSIVVHVTAHAQNFDGQTGEYIEVSVSDTGAGISKEELPFIFDKYKEFLTGKTSERKTTGLGLAICRSIIDAHRGKMLAESEVGKGTTIRFFLPTDTV